VLGGEPFAQRSEEMTGVAAHALDATRQGVTRG
jgi:hypothetical protein